MRWAPDREDRAAWSAAGGVVTIAAAAVAVVSPLWPLFAALAALGFYCVLAPLLHWWPHTHGRQPVEPLTSFELWLQGRIQAAATIARQREVRGDKQYLHMMEDWHNKNAWEMMVKNGASHLVGSYQGDDVEAPHDERYYLHRLAWLEDTFRKLRK